MNKEFVFTHEMGKLEAEGLNTLAAFAFSCHFNPSSRLEMWLVDLLTPKCWGRNVGDVAFP